MAVKETYDLVNAMTSDSSCLQFDHPLAHEDLLPVCLGEDYQGTLSSWDLLIATASTRTGGDDHLITGGSKGATNDNAEANKTAKEVGGNGSVTSHGGTKRYLRPSGGSWLMGKESEVTGGDAPRSDC